MSTIVPHIFDNVHKLCVGAMFKDWTLFFLIGIHSMQRWTATTKHGVTKKKKHKKITPYKKYV